MARVQIGLGLAMRAGEKYRRSKITNIFYPNVQIYKQCWSAWLCMNIPRRGQDYLAWAKGLWMRGTLMRLYLSLGIRYLHLSFCISIPAGHVPNISRNPNVFDQRKNIYQPISLPSIALGWADGKANAWIRGVRAKPGENIKHTDLKTQILISVAFVSHITIIQVS